MAKEFADKARIFWREKNYKEAVKNFSAAIALAPDFWDYYKLRGNLNLEAKNYQAAIADYDILIANSDRINQTCKELEKKSLFETLDAISAVCPFEEIYMLRGIAKEKLGDKIGACKDFREVPMLAATYENFEAVCGAGISSKTGNTSSRSSINLSDVMWETVEVVLPASITGDTDGSVTTAKRYYYFDQQGKVTAITVFSNSGGVELKLVPDLVDLGDGLKYRDRYKYVPTSPDSSSVEKIGTYTIKGKSLTFEIPGSYTVNAIIYDDLIGGTLTDIQGKKSKWIVSKRPPKKDE